MSVCDFHLLNDKAVSFMFYCAHFPLTLGCLSQKQVVREGILVTWITEKYMTQFLGTSGAEIHLTIWKSNGNYASFSFNYFL